LNGKEMINIIVTFPIFIRENILKIVWHKLEKYLEFKIGRNGGLEF
jgi:hypothetical protein